MPYFRGFSSPHYLSTVRLEKWSLRKCSQSKREKTWEMGSPANLLCVCVCVCVCACVCARIHISFYCNKATCTLLMFKTEHHLSFPVKQEEKFINKQDQNYSRECQLQIRSYRLCWFSHWVAGFKSSLGKNFILKHHLKLQGCPLNTTIKHAKREAMLSKCPLNSLKSLKPAICWPSITPVFFFSLFFNKRK